MIKGLETKSVSVFEKGGLGYLKPGLGLAKGATDTTQ